MSDDFFSNFGLTLRALRNSKNLSQEDFASLCGLDRTYISGLERGARNPTLKVIKQLTSSLEISPSALFSKVEELNDKTR